MTTPIAHRLFGISFKPEPTHSVREMVTAVRKAAGQLKHKVVVGRTSDTVADAYELFQSFQLQHLPVLSGTQIIGMVSSTDLLQFFAEDTQRNPASTTLEEVMTSNPTVIQAEAPAAELIRTLAHSPFHCVPVVSVNGEIWEIVTTRDLVQFFELAME